MNATGASVTANRGMGSRSSITQRCAFEPEQGVPGKTNIVGVSLVRNACQLASMACLAAAACRAPSLISSCWTSV